MTYRLVYHHAVSEEDLPEVPANIATRIARAIETRLTTNPEKYGTPLKRTLKGYWKLRVGDYRVVYRVAGDKVRILAIRHRRSVYGELVSRGE
ncbi:MAG TPA: type II toxin-antitoxin system RelE/ParE family toxin [bacterium]|nr:type II toxin-antitoxin system RelE/ParE family toxin [bacterium]